MQNDNERRNATDQHDSTKRQSDNSKEVDENNMGVHVGSGAVKEINRLCSKAALTRNLLIQCQIQDCQQLYSLKQT